MKIYYFFKRNGFISSLKSKIAHNSYQIRASLCIHEKIKFFQRFDLFLMENICTLMDESFFTPFAIQTSSINAQQDHKPTTRNPSPRESPYFAKNFHTFLKNRILKSSHFQPLSSTQSCSVGKFE